MTSEVSSQAQADHTASLVLTWAVLVALTLASWWFSDHGLGPLTAAAAILVLSFVKVFMVGHSFMELRFAPRMYQVLFALWCLGICSVLVAMALML